ncbi:MAG: hypothetical protein JRI79_00900 [Deltaproteobacteria bacterium]|nr:hypothetical protein [Deltaproteobacteria bacterium]MBW1919020.1 hypothetical protein [Deltaproteobacteria bacterium]MBW1934371.1 hypothetical protein [Deltaproteobacteria bacterium]MBW1976515.1 hypothetical protein [Deltaproteobacteria bacterium]MBW2043790.1 hypothetical protein [Deltaproteobacteria bacterium]
MEWNQEDGKHPRFSPHGVSVHLEEIKQKHVKYFQEDHEKVQELKKKHNVYGNIVSP